MGKNKKILITAGPVWVSIDRVRVITNIFNGNLGLEIAKEAFRRDFDVTLVCGPGRIFLPKSKKRFRIIRFKFFDEFFKIITNELKHAAYNIMVHSAAVSDYKPIKVSAAKIKSGKSELVIRLKPTVKVVNLIKKVRPDIFLVKFKLEVNKGGKLLRKIAYKSMKESNADMIVANDFLDITNKSNSHKAFIIKKDGSYEKVIGKKNIAKKIITLVSY